MRHPHPTSPSGPTRVFDNRGLVVSLPAVELVGVRALGSVFTRDHLMQSPLSHDLRTAIALIDSACKARDRPLLFVSRPEMFTHGSTLLWLRSKLGEIADHLCISDGSAVRWIPDLHNHVFFYRQHSHVAVEALRKLRRRAPELLSMFQSQLNTAFALNEAGADPASVLLQPFDDDTEPVVHRFKFFLNREDIAGSVETIVGRRVSNETDLAGFTQFAYLHVTDAALHDPVFLGFMIDLIKRTFFTSTTCLLLHIPAAGSSGLRQQLSSFLNRLSMAPGRIPKTLASNVFCLVGTFNAVQKLELQGQTDLFVHPSFDFWNASPDYFGRFRTVTVIGANDDISVDTLDELLEAAFGRKAVLHIDRSAGSRAGQSL